jgi:hypothetical protein
LYRPRADIRIVPSKLSGSPHVFGTRVETRALAGLARDGYDADNIAAKVPEGPSSDAGEAPYPQDATKRAAAYDAPHHAPLPRLEEAVST